jgi:hypothetical protein
MPARRASAPDAACLANEAVVDDLEKETRRMVEFLGLPSVEAVLRFHETEQPVRTVSVNQVREPIYRTSAGRWRKQSTALAAASRRPFALRPHKVSIARFRAV